MSSRLIGLDLWEGSGRKEYVLRDEDRRSFGATLNMESFEFQDYE